MLSVVGTRTRMRWVFVSYDDITNKIWSSMFLTQSEL